MAKWEKAKSSNHIRRLHKAITGRIMAWGFDVWISYAKRSKSRYFDFHIARHKIRIRLSDHISKRIREFDYDIWVDKPRPNAFSYEEWLKDVEGKITAIREQENARKKSVGYGDDTDCQPRQSATRSPITDESPGTEGDFERETNSQTGIGSMGKGQEGIL
jgi:hypothetical protein